MKIIKTVSGPFNLDNAKRLKKLVKNNKDSKPNIKFNGTDMTWTFAFFLVEYLEQHWVEL